MTETLLTPWKRFLRVIALEKKDILQIFYYAIFSGLLSLSLPLGIQAIVNLIQSAQLTTSWIVLVTLVSVGVVFTGLLQLMQLRVIETLQQRIFIRASFEISYRFPKLVMEHLRSLYAPELANRFFDTLTIQKGLSKILVDLPTALLQVFFALLLLSFYHPLFIVFGLVLLISVYIAFKYTAKKGLQTSLEESKYKYKVAHWIQEIARSIISFKLSGKTSLALEKNDQLVTQYINAREKHFSVIRVQYLKMIVFKTIITVGLLLIGGMLVLNQKMNIGQFVAAEIIILLVITSIEKLIIGLQTFYDILTSIEKLGQVVDLPLENQDGDPISKTENLQIELDAISLEVPGNIKPVLKNITYQIKPGSRILLEGESRSGKSSLLHLIAGLSTPTSGSIYINQKPLSSIQINQYRKLLGVSFTEELPFEGTLKENLTFGDSTISENKINSILEVVGLSLFVKELPLGLKTIIYPEGKHISKTTAKKIVLARALLKNPKVVLLEDALNQFTKEESKSIIDFICNPKQTWTVIVSSQNPYWKTYCKESIQLKKGELIKIKKAC